MPKKKEPPAPPVPPTDEQQLIADLQFEVRHLVDFIIHGPYSKRTPDSLLQFMAENGIPSDSLKRMFTYGSAPWCPKHGFTCVSGCIKIECADETEPLTWEDLL